GGDSQDGPGRRAARLDRSNRRRRGPSVLRPLPPLAVRGRLLRRAQSHRVPLPRGRLLRRWSQRRRAADAPARRAQGLVERRPDRRLDRSVSATEDPPAGASWLSDRVGWTAIRRELSSHHAPLRSFFFYLGGITLFLLVLQVASGVLLLLYYRPDAAQAYASVERTVGEVPYGSLVHSLHLWASDLFVVCLLAHPFTILVRRSFRPPHELSWLSGVVSLGLGIGLAFTGALLPWSEAAYTDARAGSELARYVPVVGDGLSRFLRGGEEVTSTTLVRAFGFHVAVLPAAL